MTGEKDVEGEVAGRVVRVWKEEYDILHDFFRSLTSPFLFWCVQIYINLILLLSVRYILTLFNLLRFHSWYR